MTTDTRHMMDTEDAAAWLGVRSQLLVQWRYTRTGPAFHRLGRLIRYDRSDLDAWLKEDEISGVAVCGIQTNMCCETTARMASDLGYDMIFVLDATHTFDVVTRTRKVYRAREISRHTAVTLEAGFGAVMTTADLLAAP